MDASLPLFDGDEAVLGLGGDFNLAIDMRHDLLNRVIKQLQSLGTLASGLLVASMLFGCLLLWIGVPVGWLWVGSQVQGSSGLGTRTRLPRRIATSAESRGSGTAWIG